LPDNRSSKKMPTSITTWDARRTELELPEEIDLQVELANVGSRPWRSWLIFPSVDSFCLSFTH
jgi:hypothetical protein